MYKEMYYLLFNAVTDALEELRKGHYPYAETLLVLAQADAEKLFLEGEDAEIVPINQRRP